MSTRVETHCFSKQERKVQPLLNGPLHQDKVPSPGIPTKGTTIFLFSEILFFRCFFFFFNLAALGLHCCWGLSPVAVSRLTLYLRSLDFSSQWLLVAEHGL